MSKPDENLPEGVRRRKRGFERAGGLLARRMATPFEKRGFAESKLLTRWPEIVGPEIAAIAHPVELRYGRGSQIGGTLVLLVGGANAPMVEMQTPRLIDQVNACYGYRAVSRIRITQTSAKGLAETQAPFTPKDPAAEPRPLTDEEEATQGRIDSMIASLEDGPLKSALSGLAGNITAETQKRR